MLCEGAAIGDNCGIFYLKEFVLILVFNITKNFYLLKNKTTLVH